MENQLDKSWEDNLPLGLLKFEDEAAIYLQGASDFQNRAIEEIMLKSEKYELHSLTWIRLMNALQIIKTLKSE